MTPAKKTPKSKAKPVPFEDLDAAAVEVIVERIAKLKDVDGDSVYDVLNRAVGDDYDRAPNEGGRPRDARLLSPGSGQSRIVMGHTHGTALPAANRFSSKA